MQMNPCNYLFFTLFHFSSKLKSHFLFSDFRILSCLLCNVYGFFQTNSGTNKLHRNTQVKLIQGYTSTHAVINSQTSFKLTTTITNLLLNCIQTREAHKINQTLAVADTSVSSDVSSIWTVKTETLPISIPWTLQYNWTGNSAHYRLVYADFRSAAWTVAPCGGE